MRKVNLHLESLEERIAPSETGQGLGIGNPGNNNRPGGRCATTRSTAARGSEGAR